MKRIKIIFATFSMVILIGCGDTNYNADGNMSFDDHSENVDGQIATNAEINPDIDISNDKSTDNSSAILNENDSENSIENSEKYQQLKNDYDKLLDENNKLKGDIDELESLINNSPEIEFNDIGLSVDGNMIPISTKESAVVINNKTYYSEDFIKGIIDNNNSITFQNGIVYIGKIIKEQNALTDEWLFGKEYVDFESKTNDSYGIGHTNAIEFTNKAYVKYSLNNEYAYFKCVISMREGYREGSGNIIIKADDIEIYKSPDISKTTKMFDVDIPINNCSILTIQYLDDESVGCIISDAIVYN